MSGRDLIVDPQPHANCGEPKERGAEGRRDDQLAPRDRAEGMVVTSSALTTCHSSWSGT